MRPRHELGRLLLLACVLLSASLTAESVGAAEATPKVSVIANAKFPVDSLSGDDIRSIFLGQTTKIKGRTVVLAILKGGPAHTAFLKSMVRKTPTQFRNYWRRLVFTGKALAPRAFKTEKALLAFVAKTPNLFW